MLGGENYGPWLFAIWNASLPGFDGFVGDDLFRKHKVCFDFPDRRIIVGR